MLILLETRWSFNSEWSDACWHHIHMGTADDRADGIMILLRRTVCPAPRIGIAHVLPGRLIHLRLHFRDRAVDLLCCYQYADDRTAMRKTQRAQFWNSLDKHLSQLPRRNQLLIAGDFNCSLHQDGRHVGTTHCTWHGQHHSGPDYGDRSSFQQLLRKFDLTALNTWKASDPPTYESSHAASRIDSF